MKIISVFTKTPKYKRFTYTPRHYDPVQEELRERESRIKKELEAARRIERNEELSEDLENYRSKIAGSFQSARRQASRQTDPSAVIMRMGILVFLTLWLIAYITYGGVAIWGLLVIVPFYLFLKFRKVKR